MAEAVKALDLEETPQSRQRKKIAKEESERKSQSSPVATWFELRNNKLLKLSLSKNGNQFSDYVGARSKKNKDQVDKMLKDNPKPSDEKLAALLAKAQKEDNS